MDKQKILDILKKDRIPNQDMWDIIWSIDDMEKEHTIALFKIFNLGIISGKRIERKKRKNKLINE